MDAREKAALKYGVIDPPNRNVEPFNLPKIGLNKEDSDGVLQVIRKRIDAHINEEILK